MIHLEDIARNLQVKGIIPNQLVTVVDVQWHGSNVIELFYKRADGQTGSELIYRDQEQRLEIVRPQGDWTFSEDGELLRLVSEAYRIRLAHLFDPVLAVHTSLIEPLPHQITAVYEDMIRRQPLRFLLADDPGAGKTVMAGLLIKELIIRGDVKRCLICVPGNLTEQWQDELWEKFQLPFDIMTRDTIEASRTGNPFDDHDLLLIRLDQVSRNDDLQAKLETTEWDIVIVDEAHKMSASFWGNELKETKRYRLGKLMGGITRHLLLMTATPHNGKEADFQLFMALLDPDRFEGRFKEGVHTVDTSDMMRRMVKERLVKFDGKPLFPERRAYTLNYKLSEPEAELYDAVSEYVREQFNLADRLDADGRKGTVGFALTVLQRRLASSPEAIYQSLQRRRKRLEKRLKEVHLNKQQLDLQEQMPLFSEDDWDDIDDLPSDELEDLEAEIMDSATAARTIAELQTEIDILERLERQAREVRRLGVDKKWEELSNLLQEDKKMVDPVKGRRKLVIFTEHRDTLNYLHERIGTLFGTDSMIVIIHGDINRQQRRVAEDDFKNNPDVSILLATDAAGEGINLQRGHLMVNYDLPWNPNRLEQRFGRIHRIGQTEVCHLWNLVAGQTREGHVYQRLLAKLAIERNALDGQVFDVLGKLFEGKPLRTLLIDAIRYGDRPEVRARLEQAIEDAVDQDRVRDLLEHQSLAQNHMDTRHITRIREDMERAAARRLQPHYIRSFFTEAFEQLRGTLYEREPGRYAISHVPAIIRDRAKLMGVGAPVSKKYERIAFDKGAIHVPGKPSAAFVCPGHPLLDATIDLILERHRNVLKNGAILIDRTDPSTDPRILFYLEQNILDAHLTRDGGRRSISKKVHFVEVNGDGCRAGGSAPYLDYEPASEAELATIRENLDPAWLQADGFEAQARGYAIENLVQAHLREVKQQREELIDKTLRAVHERLSKEITYWEGRGWELREQEKAGKTNARINSARAYQRAEELQERLDRRKEELERERQISAAPPVVIGRALIVPVGMFYPEAPPEIRDRRITEQIAMRAVADVELRLGNDPRDVSADNLGYDIESRDGQTGRLRFIEVKGRRADAETVTVSNNEILTALNSGDSYALVLVLIADDDQVTDVKYIWKPPFQPPDKHIASVNYRLKELLLSASEQS